MYLHTPVRALVCTPRPQVVINAPFFPSVSPFSRGCNSSTEARIQQLARAKQKHATVLDHSQTEEEELGTVGAVARDKSGNLAAATSTGGLVNQWGARRRFRRAKTAALFVEYRAMRADEAADARVFTALRARIMRARKAVNGFVARL
jgi:Asparaginase